MPETTMPSIQLVSANAGAMEVREAPVPAIKPDEVLIEVRAAAVCGSDLHLYQWDESIRPKLLRASDNFKHGVIAGHEFCGNVVEIGSEVGTIMDDPDVKLSVGDFVSAESHVVCGKCYQCLHGEKHVCVNDKIIGFDRDGAWARYIALPSSCIWKNDPDLPFEIAAIQEPLGNAMHAAAQRLVGRHDFTTFRSVQCQAKSPVRTLERLDVERRGDTVEIRASARSFLHNQIRSLAGSLKLVGEGRWSAQQVAAALNTLLSGAGIDGEIVLVGHSLGGVFAQYYARTYPQQVAGLVLVALAAVAALAALVDRGEHAPADAGEMEVLLDRQSRDQRQVLVDEAHPLELLVRQAAARGAAREHRDRNGEHHGPLRF